MGGDFLGSKLSVTGDGIVQISIEFGDYNDALSWWHTNLISCSLQTLSLNK